MNNNTRWADGAGLFAALKRHALLGVFALAAAMSAYGQAGVTVQQGSLAGVVRDHHREFRGIPFAAPPVGKLRFRAPQPPAAWHGTRAATKFGSACPQVAMGPSPTSSANEDCLYLNVYAPTGGTNLPVMVWIHGGALTMGTGSTYDATTLAVKGNVVVVTINYRLGVLGFLASPGLAAENPHGAAGNYGLLDQQAALRWVKANIRQFGGNPDNVTIFGESAGGVSVCMHLVAPGSKDLFHKAINQSGPCAKLVRSKEANYETAKRIASNANCANEDAAVETACLRELPVEKILDAQSKTRG